ncbi:MAG: right-handed parallel beta-helix repeat-containing protein [Sedimentisphaerales bacterium]|nr:right-handed parallel beta-helix repeat-containing protein [Sedimentisphaerales bacterium]
MDTTNGSDGYDGTSWNFPKATIQAAVDTAAIGDTITVADGTYQGEGNRDIDFQGKNVILQSQNGAHYCIIDCEGSSLNPRRGFYFQSSEDATAIVDGFTITNGYVTSGGGAIKCQASSPTIRNCILSDNQAGIEGVFDNGGGGIYCEAGSMATIINCHIEGNISDNWGGGIYTNSDTDIELINCIISGNRAENYGGGLYCSNSNISVINCTFVGNSAYYFGESIRIFDSEVSLDNSIFWYNRVRGGGESSPSEIALDEENSQLIISNCDIEDGTVLYGLQLLDVDDFGEDNITDDPDFIDSGQWDTQGTPADLDDDIWEEGDYRLNQDSPCQNTGDSDAISGYDTDYAGNPRIYDTIVDMGAFERQTSGGNGGDYDLTAEFGVISFMDTMIPGDKGKVSVVITNTDVEDVNGAITIELYLSDDENVDDGDVLLGQISKNLKLKALRAKTFKINGIIPGDAGPDNYYLIADIYGTAFGGSEDGLILAESQTRELVWKFGNISGTSRTKVKLTVLDDAETMVTFTLAGEGEGTVVGQGQFDEITLVNTSDSSKLGIKTKGNATTIGDINVTNGSLNMISAKTTDLRGDIYVNGSLGKLMMRDISSGITGGHLIQIDGAGGAAGDLDIKVGSISDLSVDSTLGIKSISATEWIDGDDELDEIIADWIGKVKISGDFEAYLFLTGENAPKDLTLNNAKISGIVSYVDWEIFGNVGKLSVGAFDNCLVLIGCEEGLAEITGSISDFENEYSLNSLALTGSGGIYYRDTDLAVWEFGSIKYPSGQTGSGNIQYFVFDKADAPAGVNLSQAH